MPRFSTIAVLKYRSGPWAWEGKWHAFDAAEPSDPDARSQITGWGYTPEEALADYGAEAGLDATSRTAVATTIQL